MSYTNKVVWSEGMFLRPQHFQQQDRYIDDLVRSATSDLVPHGWGFRSVRINTSLLDQGKLGLADADGVFPDGTPFRIPETASHPDPLAFEVSARPGTVYLALPHRHPGGAEVDPRAAPGSGARYAAHEIKADGGLVLDPDYIPPCLRIDASSVLSAFLNELSGKLESGAQELTGWVAGRRAQGVAEVRDLLLLQLINLARPVVEHWRSKGGIHPERLYADLLALSGELATFTRDDRRPIAYEAYRHEDLRLAYLPLMAELRRELGVRTERKAVAIPLREHRSGVRTTDVQDQRLFTEATFVLAVGAAQSGEEIRQNFPRHVTIGPVNEFQDLIDGGLRGITVTPL